MWAPQPRLMAPHVFHSPFRQEGFYLLWPVGMERPTPYLTPTFPLVLLF